jgi:predicted anti-sigma-YlaC factor YlaD
MQCEECREAISARLDGEDRPGESAAVDTHLSTCPDCRAFVDRAARVTRLARTQVVGAEPDLLPGVLAAFDAPPARERPRRRRAVDAVRGGLAALSVGQLGLAVSGIVAATDGGRHDLELMGASAAHFSHESAAWNLALGVAFGWVALRGTRSAPALVPVIGAFVAVLTVLSVPDLLAGRVDGARLVGHGLVVVGLLLLLVHRALTRDGGDGTRAGTRSPEPGPTDPLLEAAEPLRRRSFGGDEGLKPAGRRVA